MERSKHAIQLEGKFLVVLVDLSDPRSKSNHRWRPKTTIEEANDLAELPLDELIGNLKVYEMFLRNDGVISKSTKEKVKTLDLKAKVTRGQTSNDIVCQDGSVEDKDEEVEFNLIVRNLWKLFKKGNRRERSCYGCGCKNHFVDDCLRAKVKNAFVGGAWSDSEDDDQIEKDTTCLMVIGLQKVKKFDKVKEVVEPYVVKKLTQEVDSLKCNVSKLQEESLSFSKFRKSSSVLDDI
ncbi:hypothetical protein Tco_0818802 [Tanacetum coccineum]